MKILYTTEDKGFWKVGYCNLTEEEIKMKFLESSYQDTLASTPNRYWRVPLALEDEETDYPPLEIKPVCKVFLPSGLILDINSYKRNKQLLFYGCYEGFRTVLKAIEDFSKLRKEKRKGKKESSLEERFDQRALKYADKLKKEREEKMAEPYLSYKKSEEEWWYHSGCCHRALKSSEQGREKILEYHKNPKIHEDFWEESQGKCLGIDVPYNAWEEKTYSVGQRFKHPRTEEVYILAQVRGLEVILISLENGNRWSRAVGVSNPERITLEEFTKITAGGQFTLIERR